MSNPFYNYSGAFIAGTLARAEAEAAEFTSVQTGFSLLVTQGVDSGVVNAYVVTTLGQPTVAYADGTTVEFKPLVTNTGASTLSVNAIPAANLLRFNGAALLAGDLTAGTWVTATYNSTLGAFTLTGPGQTAVIPGSISAAAPTHLVGLTAAGGSSIQAAPIDATYAIDQSIAPTWTGVHTFSAKPVMNAGLTVTGAAITSSAGLTVSAGGATFTAGSVVVGAPTGLGQGTGTINATGLFIQGVAVVAGTGAGGVSSIAGTANQIAASASTGAVTLSLPQNVIIPTPASGVAITATAFAGSNAASFNGAGSAFAVQINGAAATFSGGLGITQSGQSGISFYNPASTGSAVIQTNGSDRFTINSAGNVSIAAPSSGVTLVTDRPGDGTSIGINRTGVASAQVGYGNAFVAGQFEIFSVGAVPMGLGASGAAALNLYTNSSNRLSIGSTGNVTINTSTVNGVLSIAGIASANTLSLATTALSAGNSFGLSCSAGTNASDASARFFNQAGTQLLIISGTGGVQVGSPTGGDQGLGTVNIATTGGYYVNGVSQFQTGTFTGTLTGLTTSPTASFAYRIAGGICTLVCTSAASGTSNATTFTITGLPAACQPASSSGGGSIPCGFLTDNTVSNLGGAAVITSGSGTIQLSISETTLTANRVETLSSGWTSVGTKGITNSWTITYSLS